jgi:hypothetical protein
VRDVGTPFLGDAHLSKNVPFVTNYVGVDWKVAGRNGKFHEGLRDFAPDFRLALETKGAAALCQPIVAWHDGNGDLISVLPGAYSHGSAV